MLIALRAPDHGKLRPWRFVLIRGAAREKFGDVLVETLKAREPGVSDAVLQKEREKPMRAPLIVAVVATVQKDHPKIPEIEQILSGGAAAQNVMLAANAQGFGAQWKTGAPTYDPKVKAALGLKATDEIIGFMYLGTAAGPVMPGKPFDRSQHIVEWTGAAA